MTVSCAAHQGRIPLPIGGVHQVGQRVDLGDVPHADVLTGGCSRCRSEDLDLIFWDGRCGSVCLRVVEPTLAQGILKGLFC